MTLERDRDLLRRRLGQLTVGAAVEQAEALIKQKTGSTDPHDQQLVQVLQGAVSEARSGYLHGYYLTALLQLTGVPARYQQNAYYGDGFTGRLTWAKSGQTRLVDVLEQKEPNQWYLAYRFFGDTLLLSATHPSHVNNPSYRYVPYLYYGGYNGIYSGRYGGGYYGQLDGFQGQEFLRRGMPSAAMPGFAPRGEGAYSISGNGSFSVEGQAAISHLDLSGGIGTGGMAPMSADFAAGSTDSVIRRDFSDAAFWNARVRTDAKGEATVEFKLPDSLTNWQVRRHPRSPGICRSVRPRPSSVPSNPSWSGRCCRATSPRAIRWRSSPPSTTRAISPRPSKPRSRSTTANSSTARPPWKWLCPQSPTCPSTGPIAPAKPATPSC